MHSARVWQCFPDNPTVLAADDHAEMVFWCFIVIGSITLFSYEEHGTGPGKDDVLGPNLRPPLSLSHI